MAEDSEHPAEHAADGAAAAHRRRRAGRIGLGLAGAFVVVLAAVWAAREDIADDFLASQLEEMGLPATYRIERIGADRQVLSSVVIGDPRRPDLTIDRVEVRTRLAWGLPGLGRITLVRPRLYGRIRNGKPSFGSLDKVLFTGSKEPFRLPDLDVAIRDGRARIDSDYGAAGVKIDGEGGLRGGFAGVVAVAAPRIATGGCRAEGASLYGRLSVRAEKPRLVGPLRVGALACPDSGLSLAASALQVDATLDPRLDGAEGRLALQGGALAYGDNRLGGANGTVRFTWRKRAVTAHYALAGTGLRSAQAGAGRIALDGMLRSADDLSRLELDGEVKGADLRLGDGLDAALAGLQRSAEGTLAAPLLARTRTALRREAKGSGLVASHVLRLARGRMSLVVPQASLRGGSGDTLVSVSRLQVTPAASGPPILSGNVTTGGEGLPRIAGRIDREEGGALTAHFVLADYRVGDDALAVPRLTVVRTAGGAFGLSGEARINGAVPGGRVGNLVLPFQGNWSPAGGLALWRRCTPLRFESLELASLRLDRRGLTLCPPAGGAILRHGPAGTRIAAGTPSLEVSGRLGETPIRIASGPIGFAIPGNVAVKAMDVTLGPPATASRFRVANLSARIGKDVAGSFAGTGVSLAAVPLDLHEAAGHWRYAGGRLTIADAAFRLTDRQADARFQPLVAEGATLTLADNRIAADAVLREPESRRAIVRTAIRHDLSTGRGDADLFVEGIVFGEQLQPTTLSRLALGVIANAEGTVRGQGRIDWSPEKVTSSGRFITDSLDFAAAFGPVKGASGTVVFTDLLGLVTAPDQRLHIASVNPGVEVTDGDLRFEMRPGMVLAVNGARWPFMGGTLTLQPTLMTMGASETRRYTLVVDGLDAAKFIQKLEMSNLNATGVFDGILPLVFDENGGRIEGGSLLSRPPGGNVSYVGELTYKDLSAMGNFAFDALKSVDYRRMQIDMNGALEGEIFTRVSFDGLSQGAAAKRNFLTEKIARLPIRFNVNLRAPFIQLMSSVRSLYDTSLVRDPGALGLLDAGKTSPDADIQPSDSGNER